MRLAELQNASCGTLRYVVDCSILARTRGKQTRPIYGFIALNASRSKYGNLLWVHGYSSVAGGIAEVPTSSLEASLKSFFEHYQPYREMCGDGPFHGVAYEAERKDAKRRLKVASRVLADHVGHCDIRTAVKLLQCMRDIKRRCKLEELSVKTLEHCLKELSTEWISKPTVHVDSVTSSDHICKSTVSSLQKTEDFAVFLVSTGRALDLMNVSMDVRDGMFNVVNSNLYQFTVPQLVQLSSDLAWVCRFCDYERFNGLLRKCISLVCEASAKEDVYLTRYQLMTLLKATSVIKEEYASLHSKIGRSMLNTLKAEDTALPTDLSQRLEVLYRRAKGNTHMMNVMHISGACLDQPIIQRLLEGVMNFCLDYFTATRHVWKLPEQDRVTQDYNVIDPRVSKLLYAKYPNKIFRKPGSLEHMRSQEATGTKLEQRHQAIVAALSRILKSNKVAFCRGLKLLEVRLRMFNHLVYQALSGDMHMFLNAVSSFKFQEPLIQPNDELQRSLRHIGYRPVQIMVNWVFPVNCMNYEKQLYCELCNSNEARLTKNGKIVYNKAMELKLRYLELTGWRGTIILESEWKDLTENRRIALLRSKLEPLNLYH
ncbi:hypothetical protein BgAZ_200210 [Babesia gibsoni]|uniref:Uncharacterized protein n=1 Tax=Babesia gibsoni TaxID=33632 RepID=A0AAD8P942_BABGI|nr:hypothetical protein BgAZ_200210 [Babesia gibsoni]